MERFIPVMLKIMKAHIENHPKSKMWGCLRYPRHKVLV